MYKCGCMCIISYVAFVLKWVVAWLCWILALACTHTMPVTHRRRHNTKWLIKVNRNRMLYTLIISHFSIEFEWAENCSVPKWKLRIHIMIVHPLIQPHGCRLDTVCTFASVLFSVRACGRLCVHHAFVCILNFTVKVVPVFRFSLYIVKSNVAKCTCFSPHPQTLFACVYLF